MNQDTQHLINGLKKFKLVTMQHKGTLTISKDVGDGKWEIPVTIVTKARNGKVTFLVKEQF